MPRCQLCEDLLDTGDLDGLRAKELLIESIALRTVTLNVVFVYAARSREIPVRSSGGVEFQIDRQRKLDPYMGEDRPRRFEVPAFGVNEYSVLVPQEVSVVRCDRRALVRVKTTCKPSPAAKPYRCTSTSTHLHTNQTKRMGGAI